MRYPRTPPPSIKTTARAILLTLWLPGAAAGQISVDKIAEVGDPIPGEPELVFEAFGLQPIFGELTLPPTIDRAGNVAFRALVGDGGIPGDYLVPGRIFIEQAGALQQVGAPGDPSPESGKVFTDFSNPSLENGIVVLSAGITDGVEGANGVFGNRFGALETIVLTGDSLEGMPAGAAANQFAFLQRGGVVLVEVRFGSRRNDEGLWRDRQGELELVMVDGLPAPGTERGVVFSSDGNKPSGPLGSFSTDGEGRVVFTAFVQGRRVDGDNDEGIWLETGPGELDLLVREGERVPGGFGFKKSARFGGGAGSGLVTGENITVRRSRSGAVLFSARVSVPGETAKRRTLWTNRGGDLELIVVASGHGADRTPGDPVPGEPGASFLQLLDGFFAADDTLAFFAQIELDFGGIPTGPAGLFVERNGILENVAVEGRDVPTLAGASYSRLLGAQFAEDGTLIFRADFQDVRCLPRQGLFRSDPDGTTSLVLADSNTVDIGGLGTDLRVIDRFGVGPGISSAGESVFEMFFTDGSTGIFKVSVL